MEWSQGIVTLMCWLLCRPFLSRLLTVQRQCNLYFDLLLHIFLILIQFMNILWIIFSFVIIYTTYSPNNIDKHVFMMLLINWHFLFIIYFVLGLSSVKELSLGCSRVLRLPAVFTVLSIRGQRVKAPGASTTNVY